MAEPSDEKKVRIIVYHGDYGGCETGCCGHYVKVSEGWLAPISNAYYFDFVHPLGDDTADFVRRLVTERYGAEHCADIDWENCVVVDD